MSAIKNADRIVFIHKGQVVEDGTHNELIALNGHYYEMVKSTHHELESSNLINGDRKNENPEKKYKNRESNFDFSPNSNEQMSCPKNISLNYWEILKRILKMIKPDWILFVIAVCSSIIIGFSPPIFSFIFAEVCGVSLYNELKI